MMKKQLLLLSAFLLSSFLCFSQNIPNGDFETWTTEDHYKLDRWYTSTFYTQRTTDAKSGLYAMRLETDLRDNGSNARGYAYSVDYADNLFDGHAFSGDVLSASFWAKHELAAGDSARVYVVFREDGSYKGALNFFMTGSTNGEFVNYNVPISWNGARTPDSVWVYFYANEDNDPQGDGFIIFDDFEFKNIADESTEKIYNNDFETWNNVGIHHPEGWLTIDSRLQIFSTYISKHKSVTKLLDAYSGDYSLAISNYDRYNNGDLYNGYAFPGEKTNQYYRPAFAIDQRYNYLQGYYKYLPDGEDTASLIVRTHVAGAQRSYDQYNFEPANEWTYFNVPISYYNENDMPDSAAFIAYSSVSDSLRGFGSTLILDALEMTMTPHSAGIEFTNNDTRIYPNPTTNKFIIELTQNTELTITSPTGQTIETVPCFVGQNEIDLTDQPAGLYSLLFRTEEQQWQKKIVKL